MAMIFFIFFTKKSQQSCFLTFQDCSFCLIFVRMYLQHAVSHYIIKEFDFFVFFMIFCCFQNMICSVKRYNGMTALQHCQNFK